MTKEAIIEAVWEMSDHELTDSQRIELVHRYNEYKHNPQEGSEWKDARTRIEGTIS